MKPDILPKPGVSRFLGQSSDSECIGLAPALCQIRREIVPEGKFFGKAWVLIPSDKNCSCVSVIVVGKAARRCP